MSGPLYASTALLPLGIQYESCGPLNRSRKQGSDEVSLVLLEIGTRSLDRSAGRLVSTLR